MRHGFEPDFDLAARDAALKGCINACRAARVKDAQSLVSLGVALIAWGLATENQNDGELAAEDLRDTALTAVAQAEILRCTEAAAA
jgi:hypothetical protein